MKNFISKLFLSLGFCFFLISGYLFYLRFSAHPVTFEKTLSAPDKTIDGSMPRTIQIPSIQVNLPLIPAVINKNSWETTAVGVSYLKTTPLPGNKGNSVMYGHNWVSLLGNLTKVKPGQKVVITLNSGKKQTFSVEYTAIVSPDQKNIVENTDDTRLTIYTCTGFLDSKRFVVVAKPV